MRSRTLALVLVAILPSCVAAPTDDGDDADPSLDDKADGATPIGKGAIDWSNPRTAAFTNTSGDAVELVYLSFALSGDADVTFQTVNPSVSTLDTVLYLYEPKGTTWGASLFHDDNGGGGKLSKLTEHLSAGSYRVLVKRKTSTGTPRIAVKATCSGAGCVAPQTACSPTDPRTAAPGVFIGPGVWQSSFESLIDGAQAQLDIQMYQFSVEDIADHVISAFQRGVAVRVILDPNQTVNAGPRAKMVAAGIPLQSSPSVFAYSHAKYFIVDGLTGVISTGNFNVGGVSIERNYALTDTDPDDISDLQSIYEADWSNNGTLTLDCTRLIVSPINSEQRILEHINGANKTLDIELLYLDSTEVRNAIVAAAKRGVAVRVLLNDPGQNAGLTTPQLADLKSASVPAGYNTSFYLHAKIIIADGIAHVGSENMSTTSLTMNREVGAWVFEAAPLAKIQAQFNSDWSGAVIE